MGFLDYMPGFIASPIREAGKMLSRENYSQVISLVLVVGSALMSWKTLMLVTGSESPVVVVLSGSMEPAFYRGDILFLNMGTAPFRTGEVLVFSMQNKDIPIVHRAIQIHERAPTGPQAGQLDILTKGDANYGNDRMLYQKGTQWLQHHHILGRVVAYLPYVGYVTIAMNDHPWLKFAVIGTLGLLCLINGDD